MSDPGFLFAGLALAWVVALGYLWLLSRRAGALQAQLESVERRLEEAAPED